MFIFVCFKNFLHYLVKRSTNTMKHTMDKEETAGFIYDVEGAKYDDNQNL